MARIYEVWDTETANQLGAFGSEAEARALLADVLRVNGPAVAGELMVLAYDPDGPTATEPVVVLEGADFVASVSASA
jgi:hypothetical protein